MVGRMLKRILGTEEQEQPSFSSELTKRRVFGTRDFNMTVAGVTHHQRALKDAYQSGKVYGNRVYVKVSLVRDTDNEHDANAIAVVDTDGRHYGYLPRETAEEYQGALTLWESKGMAVGCEGTVVKHPKGLSVYVDIDTPEAITGAYQQRHG